MGLWQWSQIRMPVSGKPSARGRRLPFSVKLQTTLGSIKRLRVNEGLVRPVLDDEALVRHLPGLRFVVVVVVDRTTSYFPLTIWNSPVFFAL